MDVAKVPEPIQNYWKSQQLRECCEWLERRGLADLARSMHYETSPKPLLPPEGGEE
jgi:hypothetical protein